MGRAEVERQLPGFPIWVTGCPAVCSSVLGVGKRTGAGKGPQENRG